MRHDTRGTGARRVEQDFVKSLLCPRLLRHIFLKILMKECHILQAVLLCVLLPFSHQRFNAFHANDACCFSRQRQREVAHAAEQIEHPIGGLYIKPRQRFLNHLLVYAIIYLNEIPRAKR